MDQLFHKMSRLPTELRHKNTHEKWCYSSRGMIPVSPHGEFAPTINFLFRVRLSYFLARLMVQADVGWRCLNSRGTIRQLFFVYLVVVLFLSSKLLCSNCLHSKSYHVGSPYRHQSLAFKMAVLHVECVFRLSCYKELPYRGVEVFLHFFQVGTVSVVFGVW